MLAISFAVLLFVADEAKEKNTEKPDPATEQANRYLVACENFSQQVREYVARIKRGELRVALNTDTNDYLDLIKGYPSKRLPIVALDFPTGVGRVDVDEVGTIATDVIVEQILGPDLMVVTLQNGGQEVLIQGVETSRAHEGKPFHLPDNNMFDAVKQETRRTAIGGSKTLVLLEARDRDKLLADANVIHNARMNATKQEKKSKRQPREQKAAKPVSKTEKQEAAVRLKMGAARAKLATNDRDGAEKFAIEAVKAAEGTDLADQAEKLLNEIRNPQR